MGRNALVISDRLYRPARTLNVGYVTQAHFFVKEREAAAPRAHHARRKFGQVTWTREDDVQHDYYHAICAQHLEAALDQDGRANAWLHRTVSPAIEATFQPDIVYGSGGELGKASSTCPTTFPMCAAIMEP